MQGQSPYLVNAGLFYQTEKAGVMAGVLYNRIGKRIVGIGRSDMSVGGSINNDIPDGSRQDLVVSRILKQCIFEIIKTGKLQCISAGFKHLHLA